MSPELTFRYGKAQYIYCRLKRQSSPTSLAVVAPSRHPISAVPQPLGRRFKRQYGKSRPHYRLLPTKHLRFRQTASRWDNPSDFGWPCKTLISICNTRRWNRFWYARMMCRCGKLQSPDPGICTTLQRNVASSYNLLIPTGSMRSSMGFGIRNSGMGSRSVSCSITFQATLIGNVW